MNIVKAKFGTRNTATTDKLWQYDYGQTLKIDGLSLPFSYEVHFCNDGDATTVTQIGGSSGVAIPDQFLQSGKTIVAYIFLHTGSVDGETEYKITIPVLKREKPTDIEPTPAQESTIGQLVDSLNDAVSAAQAAAEVFENADATAITLPAGENASATYANGLFLFGIPAGERGETGPQGEQGETGPQGEQGVPGEDGQDGVTPDFSIGTVSTLPAGNNATASITGTPGSPVLNLGIPRGDPGSSASIDPYNSNPTALGTASPGTSNKFSRGDHVHPIPSASDVGAIAANQGAVNAGKFLVVGNDGTVSPTEIPSAHGENF